MNRRGIIGIMIGDWERDVVGGEIIKEYSVEVS